MPDSKQLLYDLWTKATTPLVDVPQFTHEADDWRTTALAKDIGNYGSDVLENMTSPLGAASMVAGVGAGGLLKAGLTAAAKKAAITDAVLNLPYMAEGATNIARGLSSGNSSQAGSGAIEAGLSAIGLRGAGQPLMRTLGRELAQVAVPIVAGGVVGKHGITTGNDQTDSLLRALASTGAGMGVAHASNKMFDPDDITLSHKVLTGGSDHTSGVEEAVAEGLSIGAQPGAARKKPSAPTIDPAHRETIMAERAYLEGKHAELSQAPPRVGRSVKLNTLANHAHQEALDNIEQRWHAATAQLQGIAPSKPAPRSMAPRLVKQHANDPVEFGPRTVARGTEPERPAEEPRGSYPFPARPGAEPIAVISDRDLTKTEQKFFRLLAKGFRDKGEEVIMRTDGNGGVGAEVQMATGFHGRETYLPASYWDPAKYMNSNKFKDDKPAPKHLTRPPVQRTASDPLSVDITTLPKYAEAQAMVEKYTPFAEWGNPDKKFLQDLLTRHAFQILGTNLDRPASRIYMNVIDHYGNSNKISQSRWIRDFAKEYAPDSRIINLGDPDVRAITRPSVEAVDEQANAIAKRGSTEAFHSYSTEGYAPTEADGGSFGAAESRSRQKPGHENTNEETISSKGGEANAHQWAQISRTLDENARVTDQLRDLFRLKRFRNPSEPAIPEGLEPNIPWVRPRTVPDKKQPNVQTRRTLPLGSISTLPEPRKNIRVPSEPSSNDLRVLAGRAQGAERQRLLAAWHELNSGTSTQKHWDAKNALDTKDDAYLREVARADEDRVKARSRRGITGAFEPARLVSPTSPAQTPAQRAKMVEMRRLADLPLPKGKLTYPPKVLAARKWLAGLQTPKP